jgi:uncharacterized damage-inducible protein DinB
MTTCQTITLDYDEEMKNTRKLLALAPLDEAHRNYQPHTRSMPLGTLATHIAEIPSWLELALDREVFVLPADWVQHVAASNGELLEIFDKSVATGRAALSAVSDAEMQKDWTFKFGDTFSMTTPRTQVVRSFLNHLVHHRAQLGVYLRLNNIPIPGMYGPSADETSPMP